MSATVSLILSHSIFSSFDEDHFAFPFSSLLLVTECTLLLLRAATMSRPSIFGLVPRFDVRLFLPPLYYKCRSNTKCDPRKLPTFLICCFSPISSSMHSPISSALDLLARRDANGSVTSKPQASLAAGRHPVWLHGYTGQIRT